MLKNSKFLALMLAAAFVFVLAGLAQQAASDTAKDPVCGMSVKVASAKYTYDDKGTTYYFCSEGCKTEFAKNPDKYLPKAATAMVAQQAASDTAKDPVCGMSVKVASAKYTYDYKGTTYYFCGEGCKTEFAKNPEKYLEKKDVTKPMGGGMMMHQGQQMQMKAGEQGGCNMENCPMMMKDVDKKIENTKDGVIITLTSKNSETVKKIQEHAAMMKEGKGGMTGKKGEEGCPMGKDCPMKKK